METAVERRVRVLTAWVAGSTLLSAALLLSAFAQRGGQQVADEITVNRIRFVDSAGVERARIGVQSERGSAPGLLFYDTTGKARVRVGAAIGKGAFAGVVFYNEDQTEAGVVMHNGRRDQDGSIRASSVVTMDQFRSDEVVRLAYSQQGNQKRQALIVNDRPDVLNPRAQELLDELARALQSARTPAEAQKLRDDFAAKVPARDWVARRLFAGRDVDGASQVTLSDPDGRPRLRLRVDSLGQASIAFLDTAGRTVRIFTP
jgi:hypothetical protein